MSHREGKTLKIAEVTKGGEEERQQLSKMFCINLHFHAHENMLGKYHKCFLVLNQNNMHRTFTHKSCNWHFICGFLH